MTKLGCLKRAFKIVHIKKFLFSVLPSGEGFFFFLTISSYKLMTGYPWGDLGAFK